MWWWREYVYGRGRGGSSLQVLAEGKNKFPCLLSNVCSWTMQSPGSILQLPVVKDSGKWRTWKLCFFSESCSHIRTVVHRIIDFDRRKRRMNLGICKQNASNPRIRSSCCRILTPPAEFDTSRRNHWCCLRILSSTHLCWSCFGAGRRGNVLFLSTGLQQ
jgi:hypothetical protein